MAALWPAPCRRLGMVLPAPITGCRADLKRQPARLGLAPRGRTAHVKTSPCAEAGGRAGVSSKCSVVCAGPQTEMWAESCSERGSHSPCVKASRTQTCADRGEPARSPSLRESAGWPCRHPAGKASGPSPSQTPDPSQPGWGRCWTGGCWEVDPACAPRGLGSAPGNLVWGACPSSLESPGL